MKDRRSLQLALCAGVLSGAVATSELSAIFSSPAPEVLAPSARALSNDFQDVAARVSPAIVSVRKYQRRSSFGRLSQVAQGSGVVITEGGVVVTNNHVVTGADEVRVTFEDGTTEVVDVLGTDPEADLAVLQLRGDGPFPHAPLALDRDPVVGEWVLALGNPKGLGHTVTAGILSGKGRSGLNIATYENFLQTDAAINQGNSGGPLVDLDGRVLGINTAIGTELGGTNGLGFAIPATMVQRTQRDIVAFGSVQRGYLGVRMKSISERNAENRGYDGRSRVAILEVIEDGPAFLAGVENDDVIHAFNGHELLDERDLLHRIAEAQPGSEVIVEIWRDGEKLLLPITPEIRDL